MVSGFCLSMESFGFQLQCRGLGVSYLVRRVSGFELSVKG